MANRSRKRSLLPTVLIHLGLVAGLIFATFPILWMICASVKSNAEIFALPPRLLPEHFTATAYAAILGDPVKVRFFLNSYLVAIVVTVLTLLIAIITAYGFSRYTFRFKNVLSIFIISTQTVPPITLLIPYFGRLITGFGVMEAGRAAARRP